MHIWNKLKYIFCCPSPENITQNPLFLSPPPYSIIIKKINTTLPQYTSLPSNTVGNPLANHIARKTAHLDLIVDAFGGIGGNTISFAEHSENIIVFEINKNKVKLIQSNCQKAYLSQKVEVICQNFFLIKDFPVDLVFLNPDCAQKQSIFTSLNPNIRISLQKSLKMTKGIVLLLPNWVEIKELSELFTQELYNLDHMPFSFEFEHIFVNNKIKKTVVYYGTACSISFQDELEFVSNMILNYHDDKERSNINHYLHQISKDISIQQMIQLLQNMNYKKNNTSLKLFQNFKKKLNKISEDLKSQRINSVQSLQKQSNLNQNYFQQKFQESKQCDLEESITKYSLIDIEQMQQSLECDFLTIAKNLSE